MKMKFPKEYIKHGDFVLHSGEHSEIFYDVEEIVTNFIYFRELLQQIPLSNHYVGILTGGGLMAIGAHVRNPGSKLSLIKGEKLIGARPIGEWMLIDDVVTSGKSLENAVRIIGNVPRRIFVAVDRRPENKNPKVSSIFEL